MKKCILRGIALSAITGLLLTVHAQETTDQSQFPAVTQQPVDGAIQIGSSTTFSVQTTNADSFQWLRNGVALEGQTNSSLTINAVSTNDVGYYSAAVIKGSEVVPTRSASLNVFTSLDMGGGGPIVVFGLPVVSGGGSGNGCPGRFSGYVNFTKTVSDGWGWKASTNTSFHTATDGNRSDTKIQYLGAYGDNSCGQTTVTVPNPAMSPVYRFTIYFPVGSQVPTNAYPVTLTGFDQ